MSLPPPANDDATIRIAPGRPTPGPPTPAPRSAGRRWLLGGTYLLLIAGAGIGGLVYGLSDGPPSPQRLGPRRLIPPLLRSSLRGEDTLFLLTRRTEQDATDAPDRPAPRERVELIALAVPEMVPRFAVHLASVGRGSLGANDGLIAEQGATIWVWLDGLGAVSAVDGQVLADQPGIAGRNPAVPALASPLRGQVRMSDALVVDGWRIDPRDFSASPAAAPSPRPLPALSVPAPFGQGGPTAFRVLEARFGSQWLGLPGADVKLAAPVAARGPGARFLSPTAPPTGTQQQLWRGMVRMGSAAPPGWPANFPDRFGQAERLMDVAAVPSVAGLTLAGFLTAGTEAPVVLADPPGLLVLDGAADQAMTLQRVDAAGAVAWRAGLPIARLRSVLPGARHLVLAGSAAEGSEVVASVALADGAVAAFNLSA